MYGENELKLNNSFARHRFFRVSQNLIRIVNCAGINRPSVNYSRSILEYTICRVKTEKLAFRFSFFSGYDAKLCDCDKVISSMGNECEYHHVALHAYV